MSLAQVVEDRGKLGVGRQRLYRVRVDADEPEPVHTNVAEDDLELASDADRARWAENKTISVQQRLTYSGTGKDALGRLWELYPYLLIAKPGTDEDTATAIFIPPHAPPGAPLADPHKVSVEQGGVDAALAQLEQYLDERHAGLSKERGRRWV